MRRLQQHGVALYAPLYEKLPAAVRANLIEPLLAHSPGAFPLVRKARSYVEQASRPMPERL